MCCLVLNKPPHGAEGGKGGTREKKKIEKFSNFQLHHFHSHILIRWIFMFLLFLIWSQSDPLKWLRKTTPELLNYQLQCPKILSHSLKASALEFVAANLKYQRQMIIEITSKQTKSDVLVSAAALVSWNNKLSQVFLFSSWPGFADFCSTSIMFASLTSPWIFRYLS